MFLCCDALLLWFYSFDLYWSREGWLSINPLFLAVSHSNNSLLQLPEVKCLASVYLSAWLSLALSPCKAVSLWRHVSFNGLHIHTEKEKGGAGGRLQAGMKQGKNTGFEKEWENWKACKLINSNSKSCWSHPSVSEIQMSTASCLSSQWMLGIIGDQQPRSWSCGEGLYFHCLLTVWAKRTSESGLIAAETPRSFQFDLGVSTACFCLQRQEAAITF